MFSAAGKTAAVATAANYIEDVFSTWLYTGIGSGTVTINNGIDLTGKGGLVWRKARNLAFAHDLFDTARGNNNALQSNNTNAQDPNYSCVFTSSGFQDATGWATSDNIVSWTFREQPKFFDVVTYTGNGTARTIAHSLGSVPGCMIIKRTDAARDWAVYHRSLGATKGIYLNTVDAEFTSATALWNGTTPTSTQFSVGTNGDVNASGGTYVAYLFAHDAGGFGLTGTDNVISCGSFNSTAPVTLGYEPQWILYRRVDGVGNWSIVDNMRGLPGFFATGRRLRPNTDEAEGNEGVLYISPTGFVPEGYPGSGTYIYIAIRRGPMKTPTTGTSVFTPIATSAAAGTVLTTGFPFDTTMYALRNTAWSYNSTISSRLTGIPTTSSGTDAQRLQTSAADAEQTLVSAPYRIDNTGFTINPSFGGGIPVIYWNFRRAPGFFDVVCYTGTGSARTVSHNLGVVPELMIVKRRDATTDWSVYSAGLASPAIQALYLNLNQSVDLNTGRWNSTAPTASVFSLSGLADVNASGGTYVNYLFASCPGVSKVGSYTGTGTTQQINCGFTGGARFVLIKRTDSTGDWYVWDSARGIVAGNDSYLVLNSTAAEVTNTDWVDTYSAGFELSNAAGNNVNINTATYIFLSVA